MAAVIGAERTNWGSEDTGVVRDAELPIATLGATNKTTTTI